MIVEVLKDESREMFQLDRVVSCSCQILGGEQSSYVFCADEELKQILEKNRIFIKLPSRMPGVAIYFSPHDFYLTRAMIKEAGC